MNNTEIILAILSTGGFTAISTTFVLKTFLETGIKESIGSVYKTQLENHKFLLKNSEKVFQYKLDASKNLYEILHIIIPKKSYPDMDWDDASEIIANSFSKHEDALDKFLCEYQSTLSPEILKRIRQAISACSEGNFEFYWNSSSADAMPNETAKKKAGELYDALNEAVEMLRIEVHEMISVPSNNKIAGNKNHFSLWRNILSHSKWIFSGIGVSVLSGFISWQVATLQAETKTKIELHERMDKLDMQISQILARLD